ncbi:MAG TPA: Gfo/Idh/MocA family oxidoreductase [Terriglobales bacterium]|nr:Gfo/Idh/MocA family oxidoreductase [Terriglobales bacterium]
MAHRMRSLLLSVLLAILVCSQLLAQSDTTPFRVVIAGLTHGHVAGFLEAASKRTDIQIVGIAEPDQQLAHRYSAQYKLNPHLLYTDLDEMLTAVKPQAVLAYTDTLDHRRVVEIAARHHLPVMMEKPLAVSVEDALAIKRAADAGHIPVLVNYETTWYSSNAEVYQLVETGELGPIRKVVVHDGHQGPKEIAVPPEFLSWLTDPARNGAGALFDFGCYGADLMTWLMHGESPTSVTAVLQTFKPQIYSRVDDEATVILTYPKAQAILQASWNWPFSRKDMEVYGETGQAITVGRDLIRLRRKDEGEEHQQSAPALSSPYNDPISYLIAVVSGKIEPAGLSALDTNMTVTRILAAARESARTGKTIRLKAE